MPKPLVSYLKDHDDQLINEYPGLNLDGLHFTGVVRGDIPPRMEELPFFYGYGDVFSVRPKDAAVVAFIEKEEKTGHVFRFPRSWYAGYVATFRLTKSGDLELVKYDYPDLPEFQPDEVHELATGDFWLLMIREPWSNPRTIPFRDGKIVSHRSQWSDRSQWIHKRGPDELINGYAGINFYNIEVIAVTQGDISRNNGWGDPYKFSVEAWNAIEGGSTAMNREYMATFYLTESGELELVEYRYPAASKHPPDKVHEMAKGDFWLVMEARIDLIEARSGSRTYIPFRDSRIVADKSQWIHEE